MLAVRCIAWLAVAVICLAALAVSCIAWLDGLCGRTLAKLNVHAVIIGFLEVSCVSVGGENLNQSVVHPRDLQDRGTTDAGHNISSVGGAPEANLRMKAGERTTVDSHHAQYFRAGRRGMLRLEITLAA